MPGLKERESSAARETSQTKVARAEIPEADVSQKEVSRAEIVRLIPAMRAFARTFYRDPDTADDLVQETLVRALSAINQFRPGSSMKSWLFTIMRNAFYTKIKIETREAPGVADCVSLQVASDSTQEWSVRGGEIARAIQRLPRQQREVLMLIGVLGVSYDEAAAICGCAMGTVKSRLSRARLRLLQELGETSSASTLEHDANCPVVSIQLAPER